MSPTPGSGPGSSLPALWRQEAAVLRRRGAAGQAKVLESCAAELEAWERERALEGLTLDEAERESRYSYSALEKMIRRGELANVGEKDRPRVRRGDLPRKLRREAPDLAGPVLQGRQRPRLAGPGVRHILRDTMSRLRSLVVRALRIASPSIEQLAESLGYSTSALRRWRLGNREAPPEAVGRLATLLRRQARALERMAAELDLFTQAGGDDGNKR